MVKRVKKGGFLRFLGRIFTQIEHTFFSLKLGEQAHLSTKGRKNWSILSPLNNLYKLNKTDLPKIRKCLVKWVTVFKPPKLRFYCMELADPGMNINLSSLSCVLVSVGNLATAGMEGGLYQICQVGS